MAVSDKPAPTDRTVQMACFVVGGVTYGLDIMQIAEVINPVPITPVPGAPRFIEGIAELRGAFLAVVDLRKRFGLATPGPTREAKYVILARGGRTVALIVDAVLDVRRVEPGQVQPLPLPPAEPGARRFVAGAVNAGDQVVMVLDPDQVLSDSEQSQLADLGGSRPNRGVG